MNKQPLSHMAGLKEHAGPLRANSATQCDPLFYMQDSRSYVGCNVAWWADGGKGYTTNLGCAEVFTLEEAQRQHNCRPTDIPWPKEYVDATTRLVVDMQYLRLSDASCWTGPFFVQDKSRFDGNDIYWVTDASGHTGTDISKAMLFATVDECWSRNGQYVHWPIGYVRTKVRPAVDRRAINLDTAIQGSGIALIVPKKPKVQRIRCHQCGCFQSEVQLWSGSCPKCGADNRP